MSDLSDEDIRCWLREELAPPLVNALRELQLHRASKVADAERVRSVVREAVESELLAHFLNDRQARPSNRRLADRVSDRVAERLAAPADRKPSLAEVRAAHGIETPSPEERRENLAGNLAESALQPWRCPVASYECTIRRQCTNKCGVDDGPPATPPAVQLSAEEREVVMRLRDNVRTPRDSHASDCATCKASRQEIALLDRLLGGKP